jgi:hypothetical protein
MKMRMGWFFIFLSIVMVIVCIGVQICRVYPMWTEIPKDEYMGEPMTSFHSLVEKGNATLDIIGLYKIYKAIIYKNGERYLLIENFPVSIDVMEGDVLEVWVLEEIPGTSLIVKSISDNMTLKYSRNSIPLAKGLHRIGKVLLKP